MFSAGFLVLPIAAGQSLPDILRTHHDELARCHLTEGKVSLEWSVAPDGSVRDVRRLMDTTGLATDRCIAAVISGFQFPDHRGEQLTKTFTFVSNTKCAPPNLEWARLEGTHVTYFMANVEVVETEAFEHAYHQLRDVLRVPSEPHVSYFLYDDLASKKSSTRNTANAHTCAYTVHSVHPVHQHELVHVLLVGSSFAGGPLLTEGIAVWLSGAWLGLSFEEYGQNLVLSGSWVSLPELADPDAFRALDQKSPAAYGEAGLLFHWLAQKWGTAKVVDWFHVASAAPPGRLSSSLSDWFDGLTLEDANDAIVRWVTPVGPGL